MSLYRWGIRPLLFRFDPEWIHNRTLRWAGAAGRLAPSRRLLGSVFGFADPRLRTRLGHLDFPNPVGLAAGFDKNGLAVDALGAMGLGAVEVGSVSAHPSTGNSERPRLFRLPADQAIVVYYGVPNDGAEVIAGRLAHHRVPVPLGVNLVETNTGRPMAVTESIAELVQAALPFLGLADYITLNLNCPNTTGGESPFNDPAHLAALLQGYQPYADELPPLFLKLTPTDDPARIDTVLTAIEPFPFVKAIVFSLPPGKPYKGLRTPASELQRMPGSLCGRPVASLIDDAVRAWYRRIDRQRHALVGVGGIFSAADAYRKIRLGASLVQIYTALIYHGPGLVKKINRGLCRLLERDGLDSIADAVGIGNEEE